MFAYYLRLASKSLRTHLSISILMVLTLGLGIGACMTSLTVFHILSRDPIPEKSDRLFYPQLDAEDMHGYQPGSEPSSQLTRFDAETLLEEAKGVHQALMTGGSMVVESTDASIEPNIYTGRFTTTDFFPMFEIPLQHGSAWTKKHDQDHARVTVISHRASQLLFGDQDPVGKSIQIARHEFKVLGVIDPSWNQKLAFYDVFGSRFNHDEMFYLPFSTAMELDLSPSGNLHCWGMAEDFEDIDQRSKRAPCAWLQYWVELDPSGVEDYTQYLDNYSKAQKRSGRFERPSNARLNSLNGWLEKNGVVPSDIRVRMWMSFGFLLVCIINTVGLLLTKFLRRAGSLGIRRALGASKAQIFSQLLVEAALLGLVGCGLGLAFSQAGLYLVRQQSESYAPYAQIDATMLAASLVLSLLATLFAGLYPAFRVCTIAPAKQLKNQ